VDHGDDLRRRVGVEEALRVDRLAPRCLDADDLRAAAGRDVAHALPEHAVHADHDDVAVAHHVHERRFHARRAGATDRQRERVRGLEDLAQPVARLVEHGEELGVEVAQQRSRERRRDLGVRVRRTRPHQHAVAQRHRCRA
jgi:hypothetical protein